MLFLGGERAATGEAEGECRLCERWPVTCWTATEVGPEVGVLAVMTRATDAVGVVRELNCEDDVAVVGVDVAAVELEVEVEDLAIAEWARKAAKKLARNDLFVGIVTAKDVGK